MLTTGSSTHGPKQTVSVQLPGWKLMATSYDQDGQELQGQMRLDTVHVDLDQAQLHATWRLTLDHAQEITTCVIELQTTAPTPTAAPTAASKPQPSQAPA